MSKQSAGEWKVRRRFVGTSIVSNPCGPKTCNHIAILYGDSWEEETQANAKIIAEAGTVANETGLTPRKLLKQRNDLLKALEKIEKMRAKNLSLEAIWEISHKAISKIKNHEQKKGNN